jgi:hypothetical protein
MAHTALFRPGSLSVVACPAQRQSAELLRKVRDMVTRAGAELISDNVYGLELANGSRVLALPGTEESIRGLTVDGWIVVDEAAFVSDDMIAALRPMRAQKPEAPAVDGKHPHRSVLVGVGKWWRDMDADQGHR